MLYKVVQKRHGTFQSSGRKARGLQLSVIKAFELVSNNLIINELLLLLLSSIGFKTGLSVTLASRAGISVLAFCSCRLMWCSIHRSFCFSFWFGSDLLQESICTSSSRRRDQQQRGSTTSLKKGHTNRKLGYSRQTSVISFPC
jgi:hypothetical protein